jgi:hypothetical protein
MQYMFFFSFVTPSYITCPEGMSSECMHKCDLEYYGY